jgi:hypothetical protein
MSMRTIIELNHDYIANVRMLGDLHDLIRQLGLSEVTRALNQSARRPIVWSGNPGIRILGQRHHSEPEWEQAIALGARGFPR